MSLDAVGRSVAGVAALNEPVRRSLYQYVVEAGGSVSRDQAAAATGISRGLAAFHLDKLVEEGLLQVSFQRLTGRTGPGAGRPSKLYRRSSSEIQVSLPPRQYELAARLFAEALTRQPESESGSLDDVAFDFGRSLGEQSQSLATTEEQDALFDAAEQTLVAYGFEPFPDEDGRVRLRNCPFHTLARQHPELVCGMNLSLMRGLMDGLELSALEPELDPQPGMCCVAFKRRQQAG